MGAPARIPFRQKLLLGGGLGVLGAKGWVLHKIYGPRGHGDPAKQRGGRPFQRLDHKRQMRVVYAKRKQLRQFEAVAGMTRPPRRPRVRRFSFSRRF